MPTFTTIALQNLLEHRIPGKDPQSSTNNLQDHSDDSRSRKRLNHIYISPALYTTPEPTPILDHGSVSPSPYVFNRKGRGGGNSANRRVDGFEVPSSVEEHQLIEGENILVDEDADDDFVDPKCDSLSVASSSELNDSGRLGLDNLSLVSNQIGEFYDATEDFSSDGSFRVNLESELHKAKLNLLDEIEKRTSAEADVAAMWTHWQQVSKVLLSQPLTPSSNDSNHMRFDIEENTRFDIEEMKQISEEILVARFVAEAMGKAEARLEAELAGQVVIESKDKEIGRLQDRLQYYEAMIHEMSQNNLESMEVARRRRERRRDQRKWLWRCIGMSIAIGASVIAYSYAPHNQQLDTVNEAQSEAG